MFNVINIEHASAMRATISRDDKKLTYHIGYYGVKSFKDKDAYPVFYFLNKYLESTVDEFREAVFQRYINISHILDEYWQIDILTKKLSEECIALLNMFDINHVAEWVKNDNEIIIPDTIPVDYDEKITTDNLGSRDQTYIKKDYQELIAVALIVKLMIPVWGEYIDRRGSELGTKFKEFYAFQLIKDSNFINEEPFRKLMTYVFKIVEKQVPENKVNSKGLMAPKILSGISSDDLPIWTLSNVVVRRLPVANILGMNQYTNLITNIHSFSTQKLKNNATLAKRVRDKEVTESASDDDDKISVLENYKITVEHPPGTVIELDWSVQDTNRIIEMLAPDINPQLIKDSFKSAEKLYNEVISTPQIMLIKWVTKPAIDPRAINYLKKTTIVKLAAITQAVLWHRGHKYLSLLTTAIPGTDDGEHPIEIFVSRTRIPKNIKEELNEVFPYQVIVRGIKRAGTQQNPVLETIDIFTNELSANIWRFTCDGKYIEETFNELNRMPPVPSDIKVKLANLILELGRRKIEQA